MLPLQLQGTGSSPFLENNCLEEEKGIGKEKGTRGHPSMERVIRKINTSRFAAETVFWIVMNVERFLCNCVNIFQKLQK